MGRMSGGAVSPGLNARVILLDFLFGMPYNVPKLVVSTSMNNTGQPRLRVGPAFNGME